MQSLLETVQDLFPHLPGSRSHAYERSEESHYVYRLHSNGKGATVVSSIAGNYKTPSKESGETGGLFAGELDEFGNVTQGGFHKFTREGDKEILDVRGTIDPAIIADKLGIHKPKILNTKPFDQKLAAQSLNLDADQLVDDLLQSDVFAKDPFMESKLIQTRSLAI